MNEQIQEQLSALMDGELARDEARFLLKRVDADAELPARWSRYHVARQTLRRQDVAMLSPSFADGVLARLEAEPAAARACGAAPWLRWSAGGAIAASVAVAALVATRPPATDDAAPSVAAATRAASPGGPALAAASAAASASSTPGEFHPPLLAPDVPVAPASFGTQYEYVQPSAVDPRLQSYLLRHYQAVGGSGQSGFVPYVLLAPAQPQSPSGTSIPQNR